MAVIKLDVEPGVVSAIYFIILDLFLLAIVDVILIHIVGWMYLKRIYKGIPIYAKSAEIPGVATSLIGRFVSPPNLFAYFIKFSLLACVLIIDGNIETVYHRPRTLMSLKHTFEYDPSPQAWSSDFIRRVERRWETLRSCRVINKERNHITFYSIAYNLANDEDEPLENEVGSHGEGYISVDDLSVQCLAKDKVRPEYERVFVEVIGCSQLEKTSCFNESSIVRTADLPLPLDDFDNVVEVAEGTGKVTYLLTSYDEVALRLFPEYDRPSMSCMRTGYGIPRQIKYFESCLVISNLNGNSTLIERWEYNREQQQLTRRFPGPIFNRSYNIGRYQRASILQVLVVDLNWASFSGQVIADGAIHKTMSTNRTRVVSLGERRTYTTVPISTTILIGVLLLGAAVARIVVAITIGNDMRPKPNTVDGLSSVAREENEPTGRSLQAGTGMTIGLTKRDGRSVHFGPLRTRDIGVARERGVIIE